MPLLNFLLEVQKYIKLALTLIRSFFGVAWSPMYQIGVADPLPKKVFGVWFDRLGFFFLNFFCIKIIFIIGKIFTIFSSLVKTLTQSIV